MAPSQSFLQLACWNPMQLTATHRPEQISKQFPSVHLLGLVATQIREQTVVGHSMRPMNGAKHQMLSFGVQDGKHTNKSTGCAILLRKPFEVKQMHGISAPSRASGLRGRAGSVTFLCRDLRVEIILA